MDAFEELVASIFRSKGYWVHQDYKIDLTPEQKRAIDNPTIPRPEIDLVAYKPGKADLLVLECKSLFDSGGVHAADFEVGPTNKSRYKMFTRPDLRALVLASLTKQLRETDQISGGLEPKLGLVFGHATAVNRKRLEPLFERSGWLLFGPEWLQNELKELAERSYENSVAAMVTKLLLRE